MGAERKRQQQEAWQRNTVGSYKVLRRMRPRVWNGPPARAYEAYHQRTGQPVLVVAPKRLGESTHHSTVYARVVSTEGVLALELAPGAGAAQLAEVAAHLERLAGVARTVAGHAFLRPWRRRKPPTWRRVVAVALLLAACLLAARAFAEEVQAHEVHRARSMGIGR
jgi:hypothetical protein